MGKKLLESLKERDHFQDQGMDRITGLLLNKSSDVWTGITWLRVCTAVLCCEHGNEYLVSLNVGKLVD
jgi:hypothetical protein